LEAMRRERVLPPHRFQYRSAALAQRPQLNPQIVCTATYHDAWISLPERLGLELLLDAEAAAPQARALNYVSLIGAHGDEAIIRDELSGEVLRVRPRVLVNATGAWIDWTNRALRHDTRLIGGTKGSHLVIDHPALLAATQGQMLYYENADGRICILFPIGDLVLVGSTDIYVDDPRSVRCEDDEIDYMLESVRQVFPAIALDRSHIRFRYAGVRPLPHSDAATTGQISRNHRCTLVPPSDEVRFPTYALIGGKWTTFRAFAEQVADELLPILGRRRVQSSETLPIGGGKGYPTEAEARARWLDERAGRVALPRTRLAELFERYGTRAEQVAAFIAADADAPLRHHAHYSRREMMFLATHERVAHLDDLVLRRTSLALHGQLTQELLAELADVAAEALGWAPTTTQHELTRTAELLHERHGVTLGVPLAIALPRTATLPPLLDSSGATEG
jgi:glycerol-3-phosphate dehydrogenase